jgi:hypothetical protein
MSSYNPADDAADKPAAGAKRHVNFASSLEETFNTSMHASAVPSHAMTPKYVRPEDRPAQLVAPPSTIHRPNYEDLLRRVSIVFHQHLIKCEDRMKRRTAENAERGRFTDSQMKKFDEEQYTSPQYAYHFIRAPICRIGFLCTIREIKRDPEPPSLLEIHSFLCELFEKAQLSAECSIVCLIYVERLMANAKVPLVSSTWRPCLLCGMLMASKVWQDLSSWNSEISEIYPQFSLQAINQLEMVFCKEIQWDLYISSQAYAKYYFALRSLNEKQDFRQ